MPKKGVMKFRAPILSLAQWHWLALVGSVGIGFQIAECSAASSNLDGSRDWCSPISNWQMRAIEAGVPAVYAAVVHGDKETLSWWLSRWAWVDESTPGGDTPLAAALRFADLEMVEMLALGGAELNSVCGYEKQPPLIVAALRRQSKSMETLLEWGALADVRHVRPVSKTLMDEQVIKDLKSSLEKDDGLTPLMICAARGDANGVEVLMARGASINLFTKRQKRYPIHFAGVQGYTYIMQLLLGRRPGEETEQSVMITLSQQKAILYRDGQAIDSTSVSTGRKGYRTPTGTFVITNKHRSWTSTIYKVAMPWFMRLNCGSIGMHAGNVPGYPASHGCIRLPSSKAKAFFGVLRQGDVVQIRP